MRPLCGASRSINGPLSNILSEIINKIADTLDKDIETECRSTEEMVAGIEPPPTRLCLLTAGSSVEDDRPSLQICQEDFSSSLTFVCKALFFIVCVTVSSKVVFIIVFIV